MSSLPTDGDGAAARTDEVLARVVVVLVRPRSPGNIGSVVRLCANYGCALRLVTPNCDPLARDARMFAIGGGTVEMMRNLIADRLLPTKADFRR